MGMFSKINFLQRRFLVHFKNQETCLTLLLFGMENRSTILELVLFDHFLYF